MASCMSTPSTPISPLTHAPLTHAPISPRRPHQRPPYPFLFRALHPRVLPTHHTSTRTKTWPIFSKTTITHLARASLGRLGEPLLSELFLECFVHLHVHLVKSSHHHFAPVVARELVLGLPPRLCVPRVALLLTLATTKRECGSANDRDVGARVVVRATDHAARLDMTLRCGRAVW